MPTAFDTKFRALAERLIKKFGVSKQDILWDDNDVWDDNQYWTEDNATGIYTKIVHGTMNDDTNRVEGGSTNVQSVPMSPPIRYKQAELSNTNIQFDDFQIYIAAEDFEAVFGAGAKVEPEDIIQINGITLRIIEPNPIYSGEQVAVYKIQVRKGPDA